MKRNYSKNLLIGFGLSLFILLASSAASFVSIQNLLTSVDLVNQTHLVMQDLERVISSLKDAETGQRGYLLTDDPEFLEDYHGAKENVLSLISSIDRRAKNNTNRQEDNQRLRNLAEKRLSMLQDGVNRKANNDPVSNSTQKEGKYVMDQIRNLINEMEQKEKLRMDMRMQQLSSSSAFTPLLIILACFLAILITVFFYIRLRRDFEERLLLQKELEQKDRNTNNRIDIIQGIAEKISAGDYQTRVTDAEKDGLGNLSFSLNKMAESLESSFIRSANEEWLQTGVAGVNDAMVGEKDLETLTNDTLAFIVRYTESHAGAFYLFEGQDELTLFGSYAYNKDAGRNRIRLGEGLVGQAALTGREALIEEVPEELIRISYATGEIKPANIYVYPIFHENRLKGVIELASIDRFTEKDFAFINRVANNVGSAINASENRKRLKELLEETRSQSEELQAQHSELENINAELENQTQQLLASEEELRVQQDELMHTNQELEERTRLLEEKNEIIVERNREIKKTAAKLARSTRYKSEFMANMSHELRTPLNSILLLSRLLSENNQENLTDEQVEYARVIQSSGNGLLTLIDEILDLSKIEAGKMDLDYTDIRISQITEELNGLFGPVAREKKLDFQLEITKGTKEVFSTDKTRLLQILKNLLSNAFKFTSEGEISLKISGTDHLQFSVKDTGIGISEIQQKHIFEAFQQADGSTRRKYGGTGLGLSISRELVKILGGDLQLESSPGKGSTFTVRIPPAKPDKPPVTKEQVLEKEIELIDEPAPDEPHRFLASEIPEQIPDDRNGISKEEKVILIVEDDTDFANSLLHYSRELGYKGIVTVRGDQVMEDVLRYNPMAVLLDIILPVKDGWQVMEELKSNPKTRHIPVHIMSALEAKRESLMNGAVDYIKKPFVFDGMKDMFAKLEKALTSDRKKVLIIEENIKHSEALSHFLSTFNIHCEIAENVKESIGYLEQEEVDCIILHLGNKHANSHEILETVKQNPKMEDLPVIVFTGKDISKEEEKRIKEHADSIVVKTAQSYRRILDEVALFLHLVETNSKKANGKKVNGTAIFSEILKDRKVLVADDDVRNIYSITKTLEQHQMEVISAIDGKEALKLLSENRDVDVVLMDMMMPELDGYKAIEQIRKKPQYKNLPVLAITAKAMMGDREKCIRAGASDYISKPVDIDQLISLLRVWLYNLKVKP